MRCVVQVRAGRLVEGRPWALDTVADGRAYCDEFRRLIRALPRPAVICADYRYMTIFRPAIADELRALMTDMNSLIERSAVLVAPEHATHSMQVERVVREARDDRRRRFGDAAALRTWLAEVLDRDEQARLDAFLVE